MDRGLNIKTAALGQKPGGNDPRTKRTFHFFARKGFISNDPPLHRYRGKLTLADVLWVCDTVAPALYEVLPATLLRFPNHLPGAWPEDLRAVTEALRRNQDGGPEYKGHPYRLLRLWLKLRPRDRRASRQQRRLISLRLPLDLIDELARVAKARRRTRTAVVIEALREYLA